MHMRAFTRIVRTRARRRSHMSRVTGPVQALRKRRRKLKLPPTCATKRCRKLHSSLASWEELKCRPAMVFI
jgi:hypothetical protein